jgi:hypothetical protein
METKTCFDLNTALAQWRNDSARAGLSTAQIEELESHLEESVHDLEGRGLATEEAWWVARKRIGPAGKLAEEFAASNPARVWMERLYWGGVLLLAFYLWQNVVFSVVLNVLANWGRRMAIPDPIVFTGSHFLSLLPVLGAVLVLMGWGGSGLAAKLTEWSRHPGRIAGVLAVMAVVVFGMQTLSWWNFSVQSSTHNGVTSHVNFWGTMLLNLVWPATALLLMFAALRHQKRPVRGAS